MNNYIAIVFSSEHKAQEGLHALWHLDDEAKITVHGAAIVKRDDAGRINVAHKYTDFGKDTAIGIGVGALLGLLAGPVGVAIGIAGAAALTAGAIGTATGLGALAGAAVGVTADAVNEDEREYAAYDALFSLKNGEFAVLAEVSEDWSEYIDDEMDVRGGQVYRVNKSAMTDSAFGPDYYGYHLYPYYYEPPYYY